MQTKEANPISRFPISKPVGRNLCSNSKSRCESENNGEQVIPRVGWQFRGIPPGVYKLGRSPPTPHPNFNGYVGILLNFLGGREGALSSI